MGLGINNNNSNWKGKPPKHGDPVTGYGVKGVKGGIVEGWWEGIEDELGKISDGEWDGGFWRVPLRQIKRGWRSNK